MKIREITAFLHENISQNSVKKRFAKKTIGKKSPNTAKNGMPFTKAGSKVNINEIIKMTLIIQTNDKTGLFFLSFFKIFKNRIINHKTTR